MTTLGHETVADWLDFLTNNEQPTTTPPRDSQIGGLNATHVDITTDVVPGVLLFQDSIGTWFAEAGLPQRAYLLQVNGETVALFAEDPTNNQSDSFLADVEAAFADWQWND